MILPVALPLYNKWVLPLKKEEKGGEVGGGIEGKSGWVEQAPPKKKRGNYVWFNPLGMRYFLLMLHASAENRDWDGGCIEFRSSSSSLLHKYRNESLEPNGYMKRVKIDRPSAVLVALPPEGPTRGVLFPVCNRHEVKIEKSYGHLKSGKGVIQGFQIRS